LDDIFWTHSDPYRAHDEARGVLSELSGNPEFFYGVLYQHFLEAETFNHPRKNPVLEFVIEDNERYTLIANCWIPRDDRDTQLSHQSIHHHGSLLLTTTTIYGGGYETWNFAKPEPIPGPAQLFQMSVSYAGRHQIGNVLFVDSLIPHIVFYPEQLCLTLGLWSQKTAANWKTRVKKNSLLQRFKRPLKATLQYLHLAPAFKLNVVAWFDYYPTEGGFKSLKRRVMYPMGTNENYLRNMFHVVQQTGNADLAEVIEHTLSQNKESISNSNLVGRYLSDLREGIPIEAEFEERHKFLRYANLKKEEVQAALFQGK